jgi:hypothetical protein
MVKKQLFTKVQTDKMTEALYERICKISKRSKAKNYELAQMLAGSIVVMSETLVSEEVIKELLNKLK